MGVQYAINDADIHPAVDLVHRRLAARALAEKPVRSSAFHKALMSHRSIVAATHSFEVRRDNHCRLPYALRLRGDLLRARCNSHCTESFCNHLLRREALTRRTRLREPFLPERLARVLLRERIACRVRRGHPGAEPLG